MTYGIGEIVYGIDLQKPHRDADRDELTAERRKIWDRCRKRGERGHRPNPLSKD